jgi:5'-nucleotidase
MTLFPLYAVARNLKDIQGCKFVIALTHMRTPNDLRLAKEVEEIDLILGGHDHVSELIEVIIFEPIKPLSYFV